MLQDSHNTHISGGQFTVITHNENLNPTAGRPTTAFELLLAHTAPAAMLDSKERFKPPRCDTETREAIIQEILDWLKSDEKLASILWLNGSAGVGKSALAQSIAELLRKTGLLATFFFSRTAEVTTNRADGNRLIPSLVYQLTQILPEIRPHIEAYITRDPAIFERSRSTQMECLFTESLKAVICPPPKPVKSKPNSIFKKVGLKFRRVNESPQPYAPNQLIVIDGLDECQDQEIQCDLLRVIADAIPQLPSSCRFLIASRSDRHIKRTFDNDLTFQHKFKIHRINLDEDRNAESDIRRSLIRGFQEIHRTHPRRAFLDPLWPSEDDIEILVRKSTPQFIYASTVLKYIQFPNDAPDRRLKIILGVLPQTATDQPFAQLDALFTYIFLSVPAENRDSVSRLVGILYLAQHPDFNTAGIKTRPEDLEKMLGLEPGAMEDLLEPLFSLVHIPENRTSSVTFLHASISDYLLSPQRSGDLKLDLALAHETLAKYCYLKLLEMENPNLDANFSELDGLWLRIWFFRHCQAARLSTEIKELVCSLEPLQNIFFSARATKCYTRRGYNLSAVLMGKMVEAFFDVYLRMDLDSGGSWVNQISDAIFTHLMSLEDGVTLLDINETEPIELPNEKPNFLANRHRCILASYRLHAPKRMVPTDLHEDCLQLQRFLSDVEPSVLESTTNNWQWKSSQAVMMHVMVHILRQSKGQKPFESILFAIENLKRPETKVNPELEELFNRRVRYFLQSIQQELEPERLIGLKKLFHVE